MSVATGTVRIRDNGTIKTFIVVQSPPPHKAFAEPPAWVWDLVKGNAGATVTVDYTELPGDPAPPPTFNSVEVG